MKPKFLKPDDKICIISPSGGIDTSYIEGAKAVLSDWGLQVTEGEFARTQYGRFSGTSEHRLSDLQHALDDPTVRAILCSRGGYGLAQIIDKISFTRFAEYPKWMIGFSDITILHNAITGMEIASIHGVMAKHLTELAPNAKPIVQLHKILFGEMPTYIGPSHALNKLGNAQGKLMGGNLSVLMGLRGSQFDLPYENSILFIEDIDEKPYHIDRMIQNLRFSGVLSKLSGLVVGQFTDCEEDPLMMQTIHEIITDAVCDYDYPVCFNFPAGHVENNLPLVLGATVQLEVTAEKVQLKF